LAVRLGGSPVPRADEAHSRRDQISTSSTVRKVPSYLSPCNYRANATHWKTTQTCYRRISPGVRRSSP
jgi:hypothetical protein